MAGAVAVNGDIAGGAVTASGARFTVGGEPVVLVGDPVADHGDGPHDSATMAEGSSKLTLGGIAVCVTENAATCGHTIVGSGKVIVGG